MKRSVLSLLLALAFTACAGLAALHAADMGRTWKNSDVCAIGATAAADLSLLSALYPDARWTAYAQSAPQPVEGEALPGRTARAAVLHFLGAPDRIAFFPLVSGRLPLDGESGACALDRNTAFQLFGSVDPGAVSVRLDGDTLCVVGVLDLAEPLMLRPAVASVGAAPPETFDKLAADDRDTLLKLAAALSIEPDPFALSGAELSALAWLLCAAPWLPVALMALGALRRRGGGWRTAATALYAALALAALLAALECVPVRLLPSRWSDLGFYGEQLAAWKARPFRAPDVRDVLLRTDLMRVALLGAAACAALWMERKCLRCGK